MLQEKETGRGGRTNMVILDGFGQITEKQAIAKAKKMGVEGDVSYDARGLRKFVNVGNGKTQIYLQDDQGGYETKGELISTNEALALRGLDGIGVSFDKFDTLKVLIADKLVEENKK